jgi:hypothetical protein
VSLVLIALGVVGLGLARDEASLSLVECTRAPADCDEAELFIGYARVDRVQGRAVYTRSWMGDLRLAPWPRSAPLPSPGLHVSVLGAYAGGRTVLPHSVAEHPLRRRKELTGIVMLGLWLLAGAVWVGRGWRHRDA